VVVVRSWKGVLDPNAGLALLMPAPGDSAGMHWRKGEKRVVFAKREGADAVQWWGYTDACMYPEGTKSQKALIKQLDAWKRKQKD
jgi:hypothetical protein